MLDERAAKHGTRGAIFCLRSLLENGGEIVGNDCGNLRHGSAYRLRRDRGRAASRTP